MPRPKYDHETPERYECEMILHSIIAEEKRLTPDAHCPHWQLGYMTSLFATILERSPAAKQQLVERLEGMKKLEPKKA